MGVGLLTEGAQTVSTTDHRLEIQSNTSSTASCNDIISHVSIGLSKFLPTGGYKRKQNLFIYIHKVSVL